MAQPRRTHRYDKVRTWVARQVPHSTANKVKAVRAGARLELKARKQVTLGHRVLVASQNGSKLVGLAVVLGEPTKPKGKHYIRSALVTHSFGPKGRRLSRELGANQGARATDENEWRDAARASKEVTSFSFVVEAAGQIAGRLSDGAVSERDSEKLLVAMIKAAGHAHVGQQLPMPGSWDPFDGKKEPKPLRADVIVNVGTTRKPRLLVIEGEWTQTAGAESAAQAYEYSRRIKDVGRLARGAPLFGLTQGVVRRAPVHALVVANKLLDDCKTAEKLDVERMDYFDFADLLRAGRFSRLQTIA